jgi:hypothetical protein
MPNTEFIMVAFGSSFTGLVGTIGYALYNSDGTLAVALTTAGITERGAGSGQYAAMVSIPDGFVGEIRWSSGGVTPTYVSAAINNAAQIYYTGSGVAIPT